MPPPCCAWPLAGPPWSRASLPRPSGSSGRSPNRGPRPSPAPDRTRQASTASCRCCHSRCWWT
eukprot:681144-Alexandrium_andersonii.AAC.1